MLAEGSSGRHESSITWPTAGGLHLLKYQPSLRTLRVVKSHIGALSDQVIDNINGNTSLPGDPTHRSGSVLVHRARRVASLKFGEVATRA